ncbi:hypothetical protein [Streptomyces sp. NPDC049881]|uniref:hypothetical protein n=1 Tax=Streptomyces sp. NPDC049881 TaxID=3155778 RepID=UPI00343E4E69
MLPLFLSFCLFLTAFGLGGHGLRTLGRRSPGRPATPRVLRGLTALSAALTTLLYAGALAIVGMVWLDAHDGGTDSAPARPCRVGTAWQETGIARHYATYLPPRYVCETADGSTFTTGNVPARYDLVLAASALTTAALAVAARRKSDRRDRTVLTTADVGRFTR